MNGAPLTLGLTAALAAAGVLLRRGSPNAAATMFHGTSPGAVEPILLQGFRGGRDPGIRNIREAIAANEALSRRVMRQMGLSTRTKDFYLERYEQIFTKGANDLEGLGNPIPGYVYLARNREDVLTRGDHNEEDCVIEVSVSDWSRVVPDEDWLGKIVMQRLLEGMHKSGPLSSIIDALLGVMPDSYEEEILRLTDASGYSDPEDYRLSSPVGKQAIFTLLKSAEGRRVLLDLVKHAPSVAYRGSPLITGLWVDGKRIEPDLIPGVASALRGRKAARVSTLSGVLK